MARGLATAHRRDDVDLERDKELVERCQHGDSSAFDDLYLRYFDRLCRFCFRRLANSAEAEDAAQEAFARAWKALPGFDGERRFYPWLSVIAANLCTDMIRRGARTTPVPEQDFDLITAPVDGGQEQILESVDGAILSAALGRISPRHREVLQLRESQEWSYQRIAEHQGVEVSTIETLLFRARRSLRREFMALAEAQGALAGVLVFLRRFVWRGRHLRTVGTTGKLAVPATSGAGAGATGAGGLAAAGFVVTALAAGAVAVIAATTGHGSSAALARHSATAGRVLTTATAAPSRGTAASAASRAARPGARGTSSGKSRSSTPAYGQGGSRPPSSATSPGAATPTLPPAVGSAPAAVGTASGSLHTAASKGVATVSHTVDATEKAVKKVVQTVASTVKKVVGTGNPVGGVLGGPGGSGTSSGPGGGPLG